MGKNIYIIAVVSTVAMVATIAFGEDRTPWKEPEQHSLSKPGDAIIVESYQCVVASPRRIECLNIGRVCVEFRAKRELENAKLFGCASKESLNYPCPLWDDTLTKIRENSIGRADCDSLVMGW